MDVDTFLQEITKNALRGELSKDEAEQFIEIVTSEPCHYYAYVLLVEAAWEGSYSAKENHFPKTWQDYYAMCLQLADRCWDTSELSEIYRMGAWLYSREDKLSRAVEEATKALQLEPDNWRVIVVYLEHAREYPEGVNEKAFVDLVHRLKVVGPQEGIVYFRQGYFFQWLLKRYRREDYRNFAIQKFKQALELGLEDAAWAVRYANKALEELTSS